jgi:hypothetical protein
VCNPVQAQRSKAVILWLHEHLKAWFTRIEPNRASTGGRGDPALEKEKVEVMPLIQLVEILIVVGVVLWLINRFIPMQGTIKSILNSVVVIVVVLWLLNVSGLLHSFSRIKVGP